MGNFDLNLWVYSVHNFKWTFYIVFYLNSEAHVFSDRVGGDYTFSSSYYMLLILGSQDVCTTQMMKWEWLAVTLENYPYKNIQGHQVLWIFTFRMQTSIELSSVGF